MMWFWVVVGAVVAAGLVAMALFDRRARRRGHRLRNSSDMKSDIVEGKQDARAIGAGGVVGSGDASWTAFFRGNGRARHN
jgi:hypothetical protein